MGDHLEAWEAGGASPNGNSAGLSAPNLKVMDRLSTSRAKECNQVRLGQKDWNLNDVSNKIFELKLISSNQENVSKTKIASDFFPLFSLRWDEYKSSSR